MTKMFNGTFYEEVSHSVELCFRVKPQMGVFNGKVFIAK